MLLAFDGTLQGAYLPIYLPLCPYMSYHYVTLSTHIYLTLAFDGTLQGTYLPTSLSIHVVPLCHPIDTHISHPVNTPSLPIYVYHTHLTHPINTHIPLTKPLPMHVYRGLFGRVIPHLTPPINTHTPHP